MNRLNGTPQHRVLICAGCTGTAIQAECRRLRVALQRAGLSGQIAVAQAECLGGCEAAVSVALQGRGCACYVFNGLSVTADLADIVAACRAWLEVPEGWIEDARPLGRLRFRLRARLPAMR